MSYNLTGLIGAATDRVSSAYATRRDSLATRLNVSADTADAIIVGAAGVGLSVLAAFGADHALTNALMTEISAYQSCASDMAKVIADPSLYATYITETMAWVPGVASRVQEMYQAGELTTGEVGALSQYAGLAGIVMSPEFIGTMCNDIATGLAQNMNFYRAAAGAGTFLVGLVPTSFATAYNLQKEAWKEFGRDLRDGAREFIQDPIGSLGIAYNNLRTDVSNNLDRFAEYVRKSSG